MVIEDYTSLSRKFGVQPFDEKVDILFYPMLPDCRKRIAFWMVTRIRPFVLVRTRMR
jgi:hypothetical protein